MNNTILARAKALADKLEGLWTKVTARPKWRPDGLVDLLELRNQTPPAVALLLERQRLQLAEAYAATMREALLERVLKAEEGLTNLTRGLNKWIDLAVEQRLRASAAEARLATAEADARRMAALINEYVHEDDVEADLWLKVKALIAKEQKEINNV